MVATGDGGAPVVGGRGGTPTAGLPPEAANLVAFKYRCCNSNSCLWCAEKAESADIWERSGLEPGLGMQTGGAPGELAPGAPGAAEPEASANGEAKDPARPPPARTAP